MADDFADVILTGFSSTSQGTIKLNHAARLKITQTRTQTPKHTMTRTRKPRGFCSGPKQTSGELMNEIGLPEEIDWVQVYELNEFFLFTYELGEGGRRYQVVDCKIEENGLEGDADGNVQRSINFQALDHRSVRV